MPNSGFPPLKYIKNTKGKRPIIKDLNIKNILTSNNKPMIQNDNNSSINIIESL